VIPGCGFSADLDSVVSRRGADEVHGHVFDGGHIFWSVFGSEPHEVVVEDDVEDPMEPVFDAPMGANGAREKSVVEWKVSVL
jgi:hypothetical protein